MSLSPYGIHLIEREELREERQAARRRLMQSVLTGADVEVSDLARLRGLKIAEREEGIFNEAWIILAALILVIGYVDNINTALIALGLVLLTIVGISTIWKNIALTGVTYLREFDRTHIFPNEPIDMTITVSNRKRLPLSWLRFRDSMPVPPDSQNVMARVAGDSGNRFVLLNSYSMHGREEIKRHTTLYFPSRGIYRLGPVTYLSGDIFTLFSLSRTYDLRNTIVVYPEIHPLSELGLPAKEPFGSQKILRSLFTDPINTRGIRDYQPQDRIRDVHWKATARRGQLQTKIYDASTGMTLGVFLNVATMPRHWMGHYPEKLERAVSVAASVANYGAEQGWGIGLYANGTFPNSDQPIRVRPGRSPGQLNHILEALAAVTEFATQSIELLMLRESPNFPWVATFVLVTAVITEEMMAALLRLQEAGRRVVLLSLADELPPGEAGRILTYQIPPDELSAASEVITTAVIQPVAPGRTDPTNS